MRPGAAPSVEPSGARMLVALALSFTGAFLVSSSFGFLTAGATHISPDNIIYCTPSSDVNSCDGTSKKDEIWAYAGNDITHAKGSNDDLHMGDGNDQGWGEGGYDEIYGGASSSSFPGDWLEGGDGNDVLLDDVAGDYEWHCGGAGSDFLDMFDSDGLDAGWGQSGTDRKTKDSGDSYNEAGGTPCPP